MSQFDYRVSVDECRKIDGQWCAYRSYSIEEYNQKYPRARRILVNCLAPLVLLLGGFGVYTTYRVEQPDSQTGRFVTLVSYLAIAAGGKGMSVIFGRQKGEWLPVDPELASSLESHEESGLL